MLERPRISQAGIFHAQGKETSASARSEAEARPRTKDETSAKGLALTALVDKGIRVNGVAPGPIWTPLIPSTFPAKQVEKFGSDVPFGRPGQPEEIASSYVFLASDDSSCTTGQVLHPNGGTVVNG
jgi:NAD(P)-dependent dehydrogenase (short-subunit alcohol dehydrogenase family)